MSGLKVYRSPEGRIRSDVYERDGLKFCVAEPTKKGTLITEFNSNCEVINQHGTESKDHLNVLASYLNGYQLSVVDIERYVPVQIKATCSKCGNLGLVRELDLVPPERVDSVPIVPIFVCEKCKGRHYSMTKDYLRRLASNKELFEAKELEEIISDPEGSINTLNEYIIRIFASKKISKIKV